MFSNFFRQQLAAAKNESLVGQIVAELGQDRARANIFQDPLLSLLSRMGIEMWEDGRVFGKSFMALSNKPEPEPG